MRRSFGLLLFALALLLTACGSAANATPPAPTSTPAPKHSAQTAAQLVAALKAKGMPITASFAYDETTDSNHLLGRPNQYTSKDNFRDSRTHYSGSNGASTSVSDGGSVEVFANTTDAQKRFAYIQAISSSGGLFAEYEYLDGVAILRLSTELTPTQAKVYQTAFLALP